MKDSDTMNTYKIFRFEGPLKAPGSIDAILFSLRPLTCIKNTQVHSQDMQIVHNEAPTYVSVHCTVHHLVSEAAHAYWAMYSTTSGADDMRFNFEAATLAVQTRR